MSYNFKLFTIVIVKWYFKHFSFNICKWYTRVLPGFDSLSLVYPAISGHFCK